MDVNPSTSLALFPAYAAISWVSNVYLRRTESNTLLTLLPKRTAQIVLKLHKWWGMLCPPQGRLQEKSERYAQIAAALLLNAADKIQTVAPVMEVVYLMRIR